ncbi:hypothetical protein AB0E96_32970 [Kitasatospora sp. NPDC036755]
MTTRHAFGLAYDPGESPNDGKGSNPQPGDSDGGRDYVFQSLA